MTLTLQHAAHPGEVLSDELRELGVPLEELAAQIELPLAALEGVVSGRRAIDGDTALRLGHWFGTSPQFWMNLQVQHDLLAAERLSGERIRNLPTRAA